MEILLPQGWPRPSGYSNGIVAEGKLVFIAGQIGWDKNQIFKSKNMAEQFEQVMLNILEILNETGGKPNNVTRLTWFVVSKKEYKSSLNKIGSIYRKHMGKHYPVMSVIEVSGLMEDDATIEIEATAIIPFERT
jgi:enamine deaminase RidA (YjgF/YER057c/UK114 family)